MLPKDMLREGEKVIFEAHPHKVCTLLGYWILGIILILVGVIFFMFFLNYVIIGLLMVIIAFLGSCIPYIKWRYTIYALTTDRVIKLKGIISKDFYENSIDKIQGIRFRMSASQRIFGCGDIIITTAGTAGVECVWENIANPRKKQEFLRDSLKSGKGKGL